MLVNIGFKVDTKFKALLEKVADLESRNLTSLITHALVTYLKEHHNIDWHELKKKPPKKPKK